jgi:hypothetical protein
MDLREAKINLLEKLNELKEEQTSNASLNNSRLEFQSQIVGGKETEGIYGLIRPPSGNRQFKQAADDGQPRDRVQK